VISVLLPIAENVTVTTFAGSQTQNSPRGGTPINARISITYTTRNRLHDVLIHYTKDATMINQKWNSNKTTHMAIKHYDEFLADLMLVENARQNSTLIVSVYGHTINLMGSP